MAAGKGVKGAVTLKGWLTRARSLDRAHWCSEDDMDDRGVRAAERGRTGEMMGRGRAPKSRRTGKLVWCKNIRELVAERKWVRRGREHEGGTGARERAARACWPEEGDERRRGGQAKGKNGLSPRKEWAGP